MAINSRLRRPLCAGLACAAVLLLCACSSANSDLARFIAHVKEQPGGHVKPLPEIKPYQTFIYADEGMRSPFVPSRSLQAGHGGSSVRPDANRPRQYLEQFPLDTLKMVGTLKLGGKTYGLVEAKDGLVHRVLPGNYMGQNDGKIVSIAPSKITLREIVPDGTGGYIERPAALALSD